MARKKGFVEAHELGKPIEASVLEQLRDPEYRKHYLHYRVRAAIAAAVKSLREGRRFTQKQLAERAGMPQSQIARLESLEDERIPGLDQLVRLFAAMGSRAVLDVRPRSDARGRRIVLV